GESDLEHTALRFLTTLSQEHWTQLDQSLQDHVLVPRGGLQQACLNTNDILRHLAVPLVTQAVETLSCHLPITDVAQVEFANGATEDGDVAARLRNYYQQAVPVISRDAAVGSGRVRSLAGVDFSSAPSTRADINLNGNK